MTTTAEQTQAALDVLKFVYELIRGRGELGYPSGELYAWLMGKMSLETYQSMIALMVRYEMITNKNNLLVAVTL